ncbi:FOXRED1 family protein [Megaselia abdita]
MLKNLSYSIGGRGSVFHQKLRWISSSKTLMNDRPSSENPFRRTARILGNDFRRIKNFILPNKNTKELDAFMKKYEREATFPRNCDILIIGGGGVGTSIAFWLKQKARDGLNVVVVEKNSYKESSMVGGLRQQFSLPENILISLYGADFIRNYKQYLGEEGNLNFTPYGYLTLATEEGAEQLVNNSKLQNELGARNEILIPDKIKAKFPWINTEGIALGCHGLENEGWFDPFALLNGFKNKAREYGAHFIDGEVEGFEFKDHSDIVIVGGKDTTYKPPEKVNIKMANGEQKQIKFAICIIASGEKSGDVGKLANIGTGSGLLGLPIPVEPRDRFVYQFCTQGEHLPGLATPLTIDPNGTYFRRDGLGGNFLAGRISEELTTCDRMEYFGTHIQPALANRVKSFESIKCTNSWTEIEEHNYFDDNGILGPHPMFHNLYIVTGFSGQGIQQTPAVGRAISELIIDGQFRTIDLSRLGFDRILVDQPMLEANNV